MGYGALSEVSMPTADRVVFRGLAVLTDQSNALAVETGVAAEAGVALELSGRHALMARAAIEVASRPIAVEELEVLLGERFPRERDVAGELVVELLRHRILCPVAPSRERVSIHGDGAVARTLKERLEGRNWPATLGSVTLGVLGTLGSPDWALKLDEAAQLPGPVVTLSLERDGCWVGPVLNDRTRDDGPCPGCLAARRTAAGGTTSREAVAYRTITLDLMAAYALQRAERVAAGECEPSEILFVSEDKVSVHTLLKQPGCRRCRPRADDTSLEAAKGAAVRSFEASWLFRDVPEPPPAARLAFTDGVLGPLQIEEYRSAGLFRDLPLVLGSIRMLVPTERGAAEGVSALGGRAWAVSARGNTRAWRGRLVQSRR